MVFGACIEPRPNGNYRLRMMRSFERWPALAWVLMVVESQDPEFNFLRFRLSLNRGQVVALTRDSRFLGEAYDRWYKDGKRREAVVAEDETVRVFRLLGKRKVPAEDRAWLKERVPESVWS